jgi:predicted metal-dependent hydrolase
MRSVRKRQGDLQLGAAAPDVALCWHEGASIRWLGLTLRLTLSCEHVQPHQQGDTLFLPLPPQATSRQIQDCAEAWLRADAIRYLTQCIAEKSALAMRQPPRLMLSFATHGDWVELLNVLSTSTTDTATAPPILRCHWRLIEQPPKVIDAALTQALWAYFHHQPNHSLFAQHV